MNRILTLTFGLVLLLAAATLAVAGPVAGPVGNTAVVRAYSTDVYTIAFRGGESARIRVSGDGDSDLDLYVLDEHGNLIAGDEDLTDRCLVVFTPRWTGPFTVKVVNRGGLANRYRIVAD